MSGLTVEIIPDAEQGGFTARVPDIPAYGEGDIKNKRLPIFEKPWPLMSRLLALTMQWPV
jgi:hypothetical protein